MGVMQFIEVHGLVQNRLAFVLQRRNGLEQTPGAFVVVGGQHPAAPQRVTGLGIARTIERASVTSIIGMLVGSLLTTAPSKAMQDFIDEIRRPKGKELMEGGDLVKEIH